MWYLSKKLLLNLLFVVRFEWRVEISLRDSRELGVRLLDRLPENVDHLPQARAVLQRFVANARGMDKILCFFFHLVARAERRHDIPERGEVRGDDDVVDDLLGDQILFTGSCNLRPIIAKLRDSTGNASKRQSGHDDRTGGNGERKQRKRW